MFPSILITEETHTGQLQLLYSGTISGGLMFMFFMIWANLRQFIRRNFHLQIVLNIVPLLGCDHGVVEVLFSYQVSP